MSNNRPKRPAQRALQWVQAQRWAIQLEWLELIQSIAQRTHESDYEALQAKVGKRLDRSERVVLRDDIAILPITGPIFRYANLFTELSGAESFELLATDLQAALDNPAVSQIILEIDSPGGTVNGTSEFAQQIRSAQRIKPVTAFVGGLGASAAYWTASAAQRIIVGDSSLIGSIGVVAGVYVDDEDDYVEVVSTQSPGKRPDVRTTEGRAQIQAEVDALAQVFVSTVARNRSVSVEKVLADFGRGGVLIGQAAVDAGMVDGISTLETLIAELAGSASNSTRGTSMTTKSTKGPVTVATTAELHAALAAGHAAEEISVQDFSAEIAKARTGGLAEGETKGKAAGREEGATAERERIKAVEAAVLPGHEALIRDLKFDGKTTGPEAAARVVTAEREKRGRRLDDLNSDAGAARVPSVPAPTDRPKPAVDKNLPVEERCKAEWMADPDVRAEFGTVEDYIAYTKASEGGHVRVLRDRIAKAS